MSGLDRLPETIDDSRWTGAAVRFRSLITVGDINGLSASRQRPPSFLLNGIS